MTEKKDLVDKKDDQNYDKIYLEILKHMVFFPKMMYFGLPFLIFISLFFVPEDYPGILPYPHSIEGKYQNRWLFDMVGFYGILLYSSALIKYFTVGMPKRVRQLTMEMFFAVPQSNFREFFMWSRWVRAYIALVIMIVILFLGNLLVFGEANNGIGCGGGSKFCFDSRTWNQNVFANFFFICSLWFIAKVVFTFLMIYYLVVCRELDKK